MIFAALLLGAAGDWIQVIIWAVVIIIGILNQLFGANNKKKPPQMPRQPNGGAGGGAAPGQKTLLDEVERFLQDARKATAQSHNRPAQQQPRAQPQQQRPQQQVSRSLPSQQKPPKQQQKKQKNGGQQAGQQPRRDQKPQRLVPSETSRLRPQLDDLEEVRLGSNIGRQAQDHLNTSRFEERAGKLSHLQQTVDSDIGGHVHGVFDHRVGSLSTGSAAGTTSDDTPTGPNQVVELVAMLKDPMSMRNAVLMREILEPPSHRW